MSAWEFTACRSCHGTCVFVALRGSIDASVPWKLFLTVHPVLLSAKPAWSPLFVPILNASATSLISDKKLLVSFNWGILKRAAPLILSGYSRHTGVANLAGSSWPRSLWIASQRLQAASPTQRFTTCHHFLITARSCRIRLSATRFRLQEKACYLKVAIFLLLVLPSYIIDQKDALDSIVCRTDLKFLNAKGFLFWHLDGSDISRLLGSVLCEFLLPLRCQILCIIFGVAPCSRVPSLYYHYFFVIFGVSSITSYCPLFSRFT